MHRLLFSYRTTLDSSTGFPSRTPALINRKISTNLLEYKEKLKSGTILRKIRRSRMEYYIGKGKLKIKMPYTLQDCDI